MRKNIFFILSLLLVICVAAMILAVRPKPVGGELYHADFKNGFDLYIEDSYAVLINSDGWPMDTPHSIWRVTDEYLKDDILRLCKEIESYRELKKISDIMLGGTARRRCFSRIYLDTGSYCYRIEILNWKNYSGNSWRFFPIRQELYGEPVLYVKRIDLSLKPEAEATYSFAKNYGRSDSINSEAGSGWYSTISQESLDELLALARSVGDANAEIVWSSGEMVY
jgi:hypothetical protein